MKALNVANLTIVISSSFNVKMNSNEDFLSLYDEVFSYFKVSFYLEVNMNVWTNVRDAVIEEIGF